MMISRRTMLVGGIALGAAAIAGSVFPWVEEAEARSFPFQLTDVQWRSRLTPQQYAILREKATERPFTHPLNHEKRKGTFVCAGCGQLLFASKTKFDSGTGWPSFFRPLARAVATSTDRDLGYARTEVHCARCGGHLGHVFDDGPMPTGLRYCMNGGAMDFRPG